MTDLSLSRAGSLRIDGANEQERLKAASRQTEQYFVQLLFKTGRAEKGAIESELLSSSASDRFQELFDQAIAEHAAGRFGIADAVYRQVSRPGVDTGSEGAGS